MGEGLPSDGGELGGGRCAGGQAVMWRHRAEEGGGMEIGEMRRGEARVGVGPLVPRSLKALICAAARATS